MAKALSHPDTDKIELASVLDALSDPIRLQIVARLAAENELKCSGFLDYCQKTNLTYHVARLREAGVTRTRSEGPYRYISLRREDLDARFPGLLDAVLTSFRKTAASEAGLAVEAEAALAAPAMEAQRA
jgi:DNA-binding transcriptional ArsR family regulator